MLKVYCDQTFASTAKTGCKDALSKCTSAKVMALRMTLCQNGARD